MTVSARSLALTGAALVGIALVGWVVPVAEAQTSVPASETGWWTRQPLAQPVADDGFEVAWAVEQEQSTAAVRLDLPAASGATVYLALKESGGAAPEQGAMRVCLTQAPWEPANPGAYADRPVADCAAGPSADLGRDAGALEWVGDITSLVGTGGPVSLVVQPVGKPLAEGVTATAPFSVQLATAEARYEDAAGPGSTTEDTTAMAPYDLGGADGGFGTPDLTYPDLGSALTAPALPPVDAPTTTAAAPVDAEEQIALGPVDVTSSGGHPWGRLLVLMPLSAGIGTLTAAARRWWAERLLARGQV